MATVLVILYFLIGILCAWICWKYLDIGVLFMLLLCLFAWPFVLIVAFFMLDLKELLRPQKDELIEACEKEKSEKSNLEKSGS